MKDAHPYELKTFPIFKIVLYKTGFKKGMPIFRLRVYSGFKKSLFLF